MNSLEKLLTRGVAEIIVKDHLERDLRARKKLRVKFGIDPTAPDLHLGHTVVLRKLRQFQEAGHKAVLIIGDFTAQIGDPSGRTEARKPLTPKEIKLNLKNYFRQAGKIIDIKKAEIHYNSKWHLKNGLTGFLELIKKVSVSQVLEREDFQKRMRAGNEISVLEEIYPILQGYDSVAVRANLELGGTDQKFNLLMGRRIQRLFGLPEQDILTVPLLEGTDGIRKMSKSFKNYIAIEDKPDDMFGKIMRIPDHLIEKYFTLLTDLDPPKTLKPYEAKLKLAETIVETYHPRQGKKARENFIKVFSKKELPKNLISIASGTTIEVMRRAGVPSNSEAMRLLAQGAVEVDGRVVKNPKEPRKAGEVMRIGKTRFLKVVSK
jgi:tyrosyl-tRNA synthetase